MADQKLLTVREVAQILDVTEKAVLDLAESGTVPAYKIGGEYLRFKRTQIEEFKKTFHQSKPGNVKGNSIGDALHDFFYFNDFYIFAGILILLMLFVIYRG